MCIAINSIFICVQLWQLARPNFFSCGLHTENLRKYFKILEKFSIPRWGHTHLFFIRITYWGNLFPKSDAYKKLVYFTEHRIKITTWATLTHPPSKITGFDS